MLRKHAMTWLAVALLVAASGFTARSYAADVPQTPTIEDQNCQADGGWFVQGVGVCEIEAP